MSPITPFLPHLIRFLCSWMAAQFMLISTIFLQLMNYVICLGGLCVRGQEGYFTGPWRVWKGKRKDLKSHWHLLAVTWHVTTCPSRHLPKEPPLETVVYNAERVFGTPSIEAARNIWDAVIKKPWRAGFRVLKAQCRNSLRGFCNCLISALGGEGCGDFQRSPEASGLERSWDTS